MRCSHGGYHRQKIWSLGLQIAGKFISDTLSDCRSISFTLFACSNSNFSWNFRVSWGVLWYWVLQLNSRLSFYCLPATEKCWKNTCFLSVFPDKVSCLSKNSPEFKLKWKRNRENMVNTRILEGMTKLFCFSLLSIFGQIDWDKTQHCFLSKLPIVILMDEKYLRSQQLSPNFVWKLCKLILVFSRGNKTEFKFS